MFSELGEGCQALELVLKRASYIDFLLRTAIGLGALSELYGLLARIEATGFSINEMTINTSQKGIVCMHDCASARCFIDLTFAASAPAAALPLRP